ncbi:hypothetical protein RI129_009975 [Pyrocoelia pectoralis]|uniref:Uncharacterized protein n=1 Tax=Pyrocoelia pectoralis TaxID=417401 RepID=A0AAN7V748_9COLE
MFPLKFQLCKTFYFPSVINPFTRSYRRNQKAVRKACRFPLFDLCNFYGVIFGLFGMGVCLYDILNIVQCGRTLPCSCSRGKIDFHLKFLTPEHERDCKLINLVLSFQCYALLVYGTTMKRPNLFLPWLTLYALVIIGDIFVFTMQLFTEGCDFEKRFLSSSLILVYNWLVIFCLFINLKI